MRFVGLIFLRKGEYSLLIDQECRYVPRVRDLPRMLECPKQHHLPDTQPNIITCFYTASDLTVEKDLPLSLSEYCDCDRYTRWICLPCKVQEHQTYLKYRKSYTKTVDRDQPGVALVYDGMFQQSVYYVVGVSRMTICFMFSMLISVVLVSLWGKSS